MDGNQVPQDLVTKVGEVFESILKEARPFIFLPDSSNFVFQKIGKN